MRIKITLAIFISVWIPLLVRVYYISIKSNAYYEEIAKQNAVKVEELAPLRGVILDRKLKPLSVNRLGFSIGLKPRLSLKSNRKNELSNSKTFCRLQEEYHNRLTICQQNMRVTAAQIADIWE